MLQVVFCVAVLWKTERPLKYETMRPVSAVISVKQRPPTVKRNVRSATIRRPRCTDLQATNDQPDTSGDHVTAHKLTTTPDSSDVEDGKKNGQRYDAWKRKGAECSGKYDDKRNTRTTKEKINRRTEAWKTRGPECAGGLEEDTWKAKVMEDKFKQRVIQLQQQLGLTTEGYIIPS